MFNLQNLNPGERFYWGDTEDLPEAQREWVEFRLVSSREIDVARKAAGIKQKVEYRQNKRGVPHRLEYVDTSEEKMMALVDSINDMSIVTWHLLDHTGKEIACTTANKTLMVRGSSAFNEWMADCLEEVKEHQTLRKEQQGKNSLPTLSDSE